MSVEEFALPKQEPPLMAFGQEEKSIKEIIAERQDLQNILAQIDAIEPMEDNMLEEIEKATKEVEKEKFRKVIDYKPLSTDDSNTIDNYIAKAVNVLNKARVGKSSNEEIDKVLQEDDNFQILTRGAKAYQLKKLGKGDLMIKDMEEKKRYRIEDHPEIEKDFRENYYKIYGPQIDEMAERNAIYEDSD